MKIRLLADGGQSRTSSGLEVKPQRAEAGLSRHSRIDRLENKSTFIKIKQQTKTLEAAAEGVLIGEEFKLEIVTGSFSTAELDYCDPRKPAPHD